MRLLVVEDEVKTGDYLRQGLAEAGFIVELARNGLDGHHLAMTETFELIVLDVMLPDVDGWRIVQSLREAGRQTPVLFLTARDSVEDKVTGLTLGADDYVTKPFSPGELVARIKAMLRRPRVLSSPGTTTPARTFGSLHIDVDGREVLLDGDPIVLTRTEFDILAALSARPGLVFSRRSLLEAIRGEGWIGDEHLVDVHIGHLRRKLGEDAAAPRYVMTVRGVGYRMGTGR